MDGNDRISPASDDFVRAIVKAHQSRAFDNIDVDRLLAEKPIKVAVAKVVGRQLIRASRSVDDYEAGQAVLALIEAT